MNTNITTNNSLLTMTRTSDGYKIYNPNTKASNAINIYLRGSCNATANHKPDYYVSLLNSNDTELLLKHTDNNTTVNRMLLTGLLHSLMQLSQPTLVYLYSHAPLGFSGGSINSDLKTELFNYIKDNNHTIVEIISNENQEYLKFTCRT